MVAPSPINDNPKVLAYLHSKILCFHYTLCCNSIPTTLYISSSLMASYSHCQLYGQVWEVMQTEVTPSLGQQCACSEKNNHGHFNTYIFDLQMSLVFKEQNWLRAEKKTNNTGIGFCSHQCSCSGSQINSGRHGTPFIIPTCFANNWLVTTCGVRWWSYQYHLQLSCVQPAYHYVFDVVLYQEQYSSFTVALQVPACMVRSKGLVEPTDMPSYLPQHRVQSASNTIWSLGDKQLQQFTTATTNDE